MESENQTLRICERKHKYHKSSDCPTCPICEAERKPQSGFLSLLAAPARRALENNEVLTLEELAKRTEKEILEFHGIGKSALPLLRKALSEQGLTFQHS
jgi:predicted RecB family nuclease